MTIVMFSFYFHSFIKGLNWIQLNSLTASHHPRVRNYKTTGETRVPTHQQQTRINESLHRLQQNYYLER